MSGSDQVSVGTVPTLLVAAPAGIPLPGPVGWFSIQNGTAATIYLGGSTTVTTSTAGGTVAASAQFTGYVFQGDAIYAITSAGTTTAFVLTMGA